MSDVQEIERERRALCVRYLLHVRSVNFTRRAYKVLRVQYNDAFRRVFGLRRYCSASAMFAEAQTDCFPTIMRKKVTSLANRLRHSSDSILSVLAQRWDSTLMERWVRLHAPVAAVPRRF
ncbi:uncharacterized protein [Choristoneura fumiferana]|uniref:uncharacterized protein n=1 Tax=Choristoneura fumiferana TaxID=7141 RepID=UPI003D154E00